MPRRGEVLGTLRGDGASVRDVRLGLEISGVVVAAGLRGGGGSSRVRPDADLEHAGGGHGLGDENGVCAAGGVRVRHAPDGGHHHLPSSRTGGVGAAAGFGGGAGERRRARGVSAQVGSGREGLDHALGEGVLGAGVAEVRRRVHAVEGDGGNGRRRDAGGGGRRGFARGALVLLAHGALEIRLDASRGRGGRGGSGRLVVLEVVIRVLVLLVEIVLVVVLVRLRVGEDGREGGGQSEDGERVGRGCPQRV